MITELQDEKQRLDQAIEALERLSTGSHKRRGRPPKWLKNDDGKNPNALEPSPPTAKLKQANSV